MRLPVWQQEVQALKATLHALMKGVRRTYDIGDGYTVTIGAIISATIMNT